MPLAKNKWRRSIAVLLCAMLIFSTAFSVTAFADNAVVTSGSMYSYFQTFSSKGQWVDVMTPSHWITDTGEVAYCLQTSKDSPYNSGYHTVEGSDYYDQRTLTGLYAILENGYPVTTGGFTDEQARYATANAIRFWCAENYCEGMPQYLNLNVNGDWIRGKYGYEDLYDWCLGLVQKARNQAASSPSTGSISFSPTSLTLTEDTNRDYFVGSATVSKSISGSYGLSHNLPDGSSITGYSGNSGDRLSIQIPTDYGEQNFTITASGNHSGNTAKLFFWQPDAYNQQRVVTCVLDTDSTYVEANMTVITPKATPKNGNIQLTKWDENGNPLPGVSFALYDSTKQQISSGTTDGSGIITFADLPLGIYYYAETAALPGYVLDSTLYPVSITEGGQLVTVTATNILARGNVSVLKADETGAPLGGVHFTLTDSSSQVGAEGDTPDDGKLTFSGLLLGSYTLQETATVPGYVLDTAPIPVEVAEHGQMVTVNATNLFARGNVSILKTDAETGAALPGVHFTLTDSAGQIVAEGDGEVTFSGLLLGSYTLQETATREGFVLDTTPIPVEVAEHGKTYSVTTKNTPIWGNLKIVKRDAYEDTPLSGAGFRLFDSGGHLIDEGYTDANGELTFESLLYGSYQYVIDTFVRDILARVKAADRGEVIRARSQADILSRKNHVKQLFQEASKAESELQRLQGEIIKSLTGESAFTPEMLRPVIESQERKYADLMTAYKEAEADYHDAENNLLAVSEKFDDMLEWAAMYNNADIAAKKMIVSRIIDRVDMYRDYEIKITLNISIEQFLNSIEMVA